MRYLTFVGLLLALAAVACSSGSHVGTQANRPSYGYSAKQSPVHQVMMTDQVDFSPESLNIMTGDTVIWLNKGHVEHTTTSGADYKPDGKWNANIVPGASYSRAFNEAGIYPYFCAPHEDMGMKGVVVVTGR